MIVGDLVVHLPATIADIARWEGVPRRVVEQTIQEARLAGYALVTDADGVRLAKDAAEALECCEALRRRLRTQYQTLRAMQKTARRLRDREAELRQETLWVA